MTWRVETYRARRCAAALRSGFWPADGPARGLCLFLPGLGDSLEKRGPVADRLAAGGHDVLSLDWCGQGGSGRLGRHPGAAHADSFDDLAEDVAELLRRRASGGRPAWLLGYSMGATVGLLALGRGLIEVAAVALVSPMLKLPLPVPEPVARGAAEVAARVGWGRSFAPGEAGRTEAMGTMSADVADEGSRVSVRDLARASPDLAVTGVTWGWSRAALAALPRARRARWSGGPALVVTASGERSVDLAPVPHLARRLGARLLRLDGGHDLFLARPETRDQLHAALLGTAEAGLAGPRAAV